MESSNVVLTWLKESSALVAYGAIAISLATFFWNRHTYLRFARNEFIKRQIDEVINLTTYLNEQIITATFLFKDTKLSPSTYTFTFNLLEVGAINLGDSTKFNCDTPILFDATNKSLYDFKKYVNNPFMPRTIADQLVNFNSTTPYETDLTKIEESSIIVLSGPMGVNAEGYVALAPMRKFSTPNGFAFATFDNLTTCTSSLEIAIIKWLKKYRVDEINIRSNRAPDDRQNILPMLDKIIKFQDHIRSYR